MKLLQINAVYGYGSTGVIVKDIDELAAQSGIDSYVAYSLANPLPKQGYQIGNIFGKKIHAVLSRIGGKQAYYSSFASRGLIKYIDKINPDIVHLHNLHSNYVNLSMLLKYLIKSDRRVVITQHDCWYFTGKCFHYTAKGCHKWQIGCGQCQFRREDTPAYLYDGTARMWRVKCKLLNSIKRLTIISVSDWLTKETQKSFLKDKNIVTIHNGVDVSIFKPTESNFRKQYNFEGKFVILGMANKWLSSVNKGSLEAIMDNLDDTFRLVLLGCSKSQQQQVNRDDTITLGFISDREELAKIYSAADVFVNISREDSLPFVNIESLACGTPIITYVVTGMLDTVDTNVGFGIEVGKHADIVKAIKTIKQVGKQRYSLNCTVKTRKTFIKEVCYMKYLNLYREVVNEK